MADKMKIQTNILAQIIVLTWGATLATACQIYSAVIRPVITYRTVVWHPDLEKDRTATLYKQCLKELVQKLNKIQNKYL